MKKFIIIILCCALSSCVSITRELVNEKKWIHDVDEYVTVTVLDTVADVHVKFGLADDEDIQKYGSDSLHSRLKYSFNIPCLILPNIKLNSFSFTDKKGDTISCLLYYRTDGRVVHIIDSLPVIFTNDVKKDMNYKTFEIFAECSQSYHKTNQVYINYDIEVGNERFVKKIKYSRKWFTDWRPKFR